MRLSAAESTIDWTIRRCSPTDAEMLAVLGARLFVQAYGPTHPEPELTPYLQRSFAPARWSQLLADATTTVLVVEVPRCGPAGYALLRESTEVPASVEAIRPLEIQRFYVDESWHGRGMAQTLMAACERDAQSRNADALWLSVWQEAPWAQTFYQRVGFRVVGTTTFTFGERIDDDYVMLRAVKLAVTEDRNTG